MTDLLEIFKKVEKPGRYIGEETNIVRKKPRDGRITVALAYPDVYEIGMSYLGIKILYHLLNEIDDVSCERVFAPWPDIERELRSGGRRLFSLESKTDINKFDVLGFSLSYELTYTNVLNMLELSGITVLSAERGDEEPLVIAGGSCCYNPEPMSGFIDVFFIGDAEDTLPEFLEKYGAIRERPLGRKQKLAMLAGMAGIYMPALYQKKKIGKITIVEPLGLGIPKTVSKASVKDLNKAYYPTKQIVPFIKIVHERIMVEIMRGCPNRCRFCQASAVNRPLRIRSKDVIERLCWETYLNTGYDEISLLSLSSVNYPDIVTLVKVLNARFAGKGMGINIPSLRVDESFYELPEVISMIKKAGLTFAPETASPEVMSAIGKDIDYEVLKRSAGRAFSMGWDRLKLYFMVGFTQDPLKETTGIIGWCRSISSLRREYGKKAAKLSVSVNPFIPKPQTSLQWLGMAPEINLIEAKKHLVNGSSNNVEIKFHDIPRSLLEGCMARGDYSMGDVIHSAWKNGAKMDGWSEFFDLAAWERAFAENSMDMRREAGKTLSPDDPLPWGHIRTELSDESLREELRESGLYRRDGASS
ncbi:MAG: TIGR03960 family B12-binding radical SAM protein [Candidatus Omnitrophica bacterium]|nr:TIGR03960 family B12-binding radical SAM protein [Candidatus Omnitrophota bacterium]